MFPKEDIYWMFIMCNKYIGHTFKLHCKSCDFKKHCSVYSDFFINFMVHNMFCNLAVVVPFLLFLFLSLCFNKYIFYGTKREVYAVLDVSNWCCCGCQQNQNANKCCSSTSLVSFFFIFTKNIKIQFLHILCLFFQFLLFYSLSTLVLWFLLWHLCLLVMLAGKKTELVALKVRHIRS